LAATGTEAVSGAATGTEAEIAAAIVAAEIGTGLLRHRRGGTRSGIGLSLGTRRWKTRRPKRGSGRDANRQ